MRTLPALCLALLALSACTMGGLGGLGGLMAPKTATVSRAESPDACYERAGRTFAQLPGGMVRHQDIQGRHLSGEVKALVDVNVDVAPDGTGCLITIHCTVREDKVVLGPVHQCEDYAALLQGGK